MARIKDTSVEAVKQAADIVAVVEARHAAPQGRRPLRRPLPVPPGEDAELLDLAATAARSTASAAATAATRSRSSESEGVDFVGAIEWLADRFNVPLEYEESSPAADAARKRRDRLHALLEQAAVFYERYLWESAAGEPVRAYLAGRGLEEAMCREFRLGLSPGGNSLAAQGAREGLHAGGARAARAASAARRRLLREAA